MKKMGKRQEEMKKLGLGGGGMATVLDKRQTLPGLSVFHIPCSVCSRVQI